MAFYFLDISNTFQSNIIHDPKRCHYLHLPTLYTKWFHLRFLNHPLSKIRDPSGTMLIHTIRGIPGTNDARHEWYNIFALILANDLGMIPATIDT